MPDNNQTINIKPKQVAFTLGFIVTLLVLASITGQVLKFVTGHDVVYGFVRQFNIDEEMNIPSYFSSVILLLSASLLGTIAVLKKKASDPYTHHWVLLSIIFTYISIDEAICIHEYWIEPLRVIFSAKGIFHFAWVIPGILLVLVFAVFFCRFLFHLPSSSRFLFTIAAILYVGGGLSCELIGGWYTFQYGVASLTYNMIVTLEETFEMLGIVVFIYALLKYMCIGSQEIRLRIEKSH